MICIDYDESNTIVYKCNKTRDVCPLFITHTTGNNRNPKQWSHDRCIEHIMLLGAFFNNQLIKNQ